MPKALIAELILSLFTTRERAASTVGDLMENAPGLGARWFWSGVSRTALSLFWCSFTAEPAFIAGIAFRGLMLNLTLYLALLLCILLFAAVFGIVFGVVVASHSASSPAVANLSTGAFPFSWVFGLAGGLAAFAVEFQTGRWIARRARNREIAACAAFLIIDAIAMPIIGEIGEILFGGRVPQSEMAGVPIMIGTLVSVIALLTGAIQMRLCFIREVTR